MKRILTAAALLLVVAACNKDENYNDKYGDRAVIPPKGQSLRVMTYNIYGARATSPANAADLDAIAEVIRRQNPDFVTLNEVDVFTNRTGKDVHQARDLAEKLGMEWHFSKAIDRDGGEYGDAVLSKYPILEKRSYRLPCAAEQPGEDRSLCVIRVQIDGKDLYVASTHLDHLSGDASRLVQATEIRRIRDTELEGDLILCGDLNAIPSSNVIATMTSFLTNTGPIDQYTFPSDDPSRKIDYIMYAPIEHFGVQNCQVVSRGDQQVGGVDASDHRPVIADIRFQTEEDISGEDGGGEECSRAEGRLPHTRSGPAARQKVGPDF